MKDFFSIYSLDSWIIKLEWYKQIFEKSNENFKQISDGRIKKITESENKFQNMIYLEIHVLLFQSIEALFNLLFALEDPNLDYTWFNLTFPSSRSNRSMASYDKISNLKGANNLHYYLREKIKISQDEEKEFWEYFFFYNYDIDESSRNTIFKNIKRILTTLVKFFADRDDYNSYKHGLRLLISNNASYYIASESSPGVRNGPWIPQGFSRYVLSFLYKKKDKDGFTRVYERTKSYSPKEDLFYCEYCISLIENVINLRNDKNSIFQPNLFENFSHIQQQDYSMISNSWSVLSDIEILNESIKAYQDKNFENALYFAKKVLQIDPKKKEAIKILGLVYYNMGKYVEAKKYFKIYRKDNKCHLYYEITLYLAIILLNSNSLNESQVLIEEIIQNSSKIQEEILKKSYELRARIYLAKNQRKFEKYQKNNSKWLKKAKKNLMKCDFEKKILVDLWFKLGEIFLYLRRNDGEEILDSLVSQNPNNSKLLFQIGNLYIKGFNRTKAGHIYQKISKIFPDEPDAWNNLGMYMFEENIDMNKAKEYVNKAFEMKNEVFYLKNLFKIIKKENNLENLEELNQKILNTKEFDLIFRLSGLYFKEKDFEKSIFFLDKANEIRPNDFSVFFYKGVVLLHQKKPEEALSCFLEGKEEDLENKETIYNISCCYAQKVDLANTIKWLKKLVGKYDDMLENINNDSDFNEIKQEPEFINLLNSLHISSDQ